MRERLGTNVKICGLRTVETIEAAISAGARWIGFVHFEKSPRHVAREDGRALVDAAKSISSDIETVLLLVDPTPEFAADLANTWGVDHIQLHGAETNEMMQALRKLRPFGEIWKAIPVSEKADLDHLERYSAADRFLFDTKPPKDADRPGGLGESFDWTILSDADIPRPWLLAGGLHVDNVNDAIQVSGAQAVDLSSGVEVSKGIKSPEMIETFLNAIQ